MRENIVDGGLWQNETGVFLSLGLRQHGNLLALGGQRALIRREPLLGQNHAMNHVCHKRPADIYLRFTILIVAPP